MYYISIIPYSPKKKLKYFGMNFLMKFVKLDKRKQNYIKIYKFINT